MAPEQALNERQELIQLHNKGLIKPLVSTVLPFREAVKGFEMFQNREVIGKLVFVTPKYEEEFGIRPKAILPSTDAGKNRIQDFLSGKIFNGEFWMLSMMKFKDKLEHSTILNISKLKSRSCRASAQKLYLEHLITFAPLLMVGV